MKSKKSWVGKEHPCLQVLLRGKGCWTLGEKNPLLHQGLKPASVSHLALQSDTLPTELFTPLCGCTCKYLRNCAKLTAGVINYLWSVLLTNMCWYWGAASSGPCGAGTLNTIITGLHTKSRRQILCITLLLVNWDHNLMLLSQAAKLKTELLLAN